tara:strand:- start:5959 stop:8583 length:2625 start_codon:yes stop_codon:yes gene_type:complete
MYLSGEYMSFLRKPTRFFAFTLSIKSRFFRLNMLVFMLVFSQLTLSEAASSETDNKPQKADIRLLIDISGSMKKNDPANLRIPSVALLTELIPDGDKAGVWTFGQWVNNLVKRKVVDDDWRLDAKEQSKKINSVALYTNIGAALEKASDDFYKPGTDFSNTHFILLTDGMIDIDRDSSKNDVERERVLTKVLSTFKERGAKIHAISLSKNADQSLMDKLAIQTGGQSAIAESSEDLTKVFVQALNQAVPSEEVPIEGNEFAIDSSIEEFTALIFRGSDGVPTEITSPDKSVYQYGKTDADVKWFQDRGYDLITITRPLEGTWKIKADIQPESRVTVVSNLQLDVSKLPANFFAGEPLKVDVSFIEEGKRVVNSDFLSLLDVELQLKTEEGKSAVKAMSDPKNPPVDGVFSESITKLSKVGQYEVTVLVDGKTFKRSKRQVVNLRAPFDFEFSVKSDAAIPYYELVVTPLNDSIIIDETSIFVKTKFPDNTSLISAVEIDKDNNRWVLQITPDKGDGVYEVTVKVKSTTVTGQEFQFKPKPFEAEFPIPVGSSNKIVSVNEEEEEPQEELFSEPEAKPELEAKAEPKAKIEPEPVQEKVKEEVPSVEAVVKPELIEEAPEEEPVDEETDSFWWVIGSAIAGGLLLVSGLVFFILKKRKSKDEELPGEILSDADIDELEEKLPEEIPVVDEAAFDEPEVEEEIPQVDDDISEDLDFMEVPIEEELEVEIEEELEVALDIEEEVEPEPEVGLDVVIDIEEEVEPESGQDVTLDIEEEVELEDDLTVDLSSDDLSEALDELEVAAETENKLEAESEDLDLADIAQAIEESADEPVEALDEEIEKALDINNDDDDEEFNLEDFDIGDTDDLPDPEEKPK